MKGQTSMLSNKRVCPRRTNVGLDQVSIVPLDWSMNDTSKQRFIMNMQASVQKESIEAKKAKRVAQSKHDKQHRTGQRKGMH